MRQNKVFTLTNNNGVIVKISNLGGTIISIEVPDKNGVLKDVVLGYNDLENYFENKFFFGCIVGRYANRIANANFEIDGKQYDVLKNDGNNHLHGGLNHFGKIIWATKEFEKEDGKSLELKYLSKDGEEGFPGNLFVNVTYTLNNSNELNIDYQAETDKKTIINLTNHSYFNLTGDANKNVLNHEIKILADKYTPVDSERIPKGEIVTVKGTPFDFNKFKKMGKDIHLVNGGYDHNYQLPYSNSKIKKVAEVLESESRRKLEVYTTQPGMQFYTGNFLDNSIIGKKGKLYDSYDGFCLETQHFPDSPNQPNFPTTILSPGQIYHEVTIYKFSVY